MDEEPTHEHREIAAALAHWSVPNFPEDRTVADAMRVIGSEEFDTIEAVIVHDGRGRYLGTADLKSLLAAKPECRLSSVMRRGWPTVAPHVDQEHAVEIARRGEVTSLPVVDQDRRAVGLIPARALIETLALEHQEDVHRLVGILKRGKGARHALEDTPIRRAGHRLPWLLVGLALSTIATAIMVGAERVLQTNITIAFFIPAIVYLADAVGTQTEAIVVRWLSLRTRPLWPLLLSEAATGALIGLPLALLAFLGIWTVFQDLRMATGVSISLFAASVVASTLGLILPWVLARVGADPAFGSGPIATIIQDVLTIAIYLAVMVVMVAA
jgi:magnesium transporter